MLHDQSTKRIPTVALVSLVQHETSERLASTILLTETACETLGYPLNEMQRRALLAAALEVWDGLSFELESSFEAIESLSAGFSVKV